MAPSIITIVDGIPAYFPAANNMPKPGKRGGLDDFPVSSQKQIEEPTEKTKERKNEKRLFYGNFKFLRQVHYIDSLLEFH